MLVRLEGLSFLIDYMKWASPDYLLYETGARRSEEVISSDEIPKGGFRRRALLALYSTRINCNLDRPKRD